MTEHFPIAGDLTRAFDRSRQMQGVELLEHIRHNYTMTLRGTDSDDISMGGLVINPAGRQFTALHSKDKRDRFLYDMILMSVLDRAEAQLAELEEQMALRFEILREKYGEDVIGGMAATYLGEEQLAGLDTDEQLLAALSALFLDENGTIKPQYAHLDEAKYVTDWQKAEELRPIVAKYQGRDYLTQEEAREIQAASDRASLSENTNNMGLSDNGAYKATVNKKLDDDLAGHEGQKLDSNLTFG